MGLETIKVHTRKNFFNSVKRQNFNLHLKIYSSFHPCFAFFSKYVLEAKIPFSVSFIYHLCLVIMAIWLRILSSKNLLLTLNAVLGGQWKA